ncbi:hypothetical protein FB446DRAFT_439314 [Lentinula raphanica]|nr:hypothetical protein FB446DRAFT_439314 [Lentinula raphanica]
MEDVAPFLWVTVSVIRPLWLIQILFGPLSFEILIADFVSKNRSKGRRSTRLFIPHTPYKKFSTPMSSSTPSGTTSRCVCQCLSVLSSEDSLSLDQRAAKGALIHMRMLLEGGDSNMRMKSLWVLHFLRRELRQSLLLRKSPLWILSFMRSSSLLS